MPVGNSANTPNGQLGGLQCLIQGPNPYQVQFGFNLAAPPANPAPLGPLPTAVLTTQVVTTQGSWATPVTGATGNGVSPIVVSTNSISGLSVGQAVTIQIAGNTAAGGPHTVAALTPFSTTVTGATGAGVSPIVLNVASTTGLAVGEGILIASVLGNTAANGLHNISAIGSGTLTLEATSSGNGAYTSGGTVTTNLVQLEAASTGNGAYVPGSGGQLAVTFPVQSVLPATTSSSSFVPPALQAASVQAAASANVPPSVAQYLFWLALQDYYRNGGL
jgi:hypothetical protein